MIFASGFVIRTRPVIYFSVIYSERQIFGFSKLKAFADDKIYFTKIPNWLLAFSPYRGMLSRALFMRDAPPGWLSGEPVGLMTWWL